MPTLTDIRWGDTRVQGVAAGEAFRSRDLVRVSAPFPCAWRLMGSFQLTNPVNLGLAVQLSISLGMGQASLGPFPLGVTVNNLFSLEVPGHSVQAEFVVPAAIGADTYTMSLMIAPLTPWKGIEVSLVR